MDDLTALPVAVEVSGGVGARLRDHVEGTLGWQVTGDGGLPPVLTFTDGVAAARGGPAVAVIAASTPATTIALLALLTDHVVVWPEQSNRLPAIARLVMGRATTTATVPPLLVGGASGGVGTSTVAAALAGIMAWAGTETLLVAGPAAPIPTPLQVGREALGSPQLWPAATEVPGVAGLRAVQLDRPWTGGVQGNLPRATVIDAGIDPDVDILVLRRDRAGVESLRLTRAGAAVVLDEGIAPRRVVQGAANGRLLIPVQSSVRVARAHAAQRVPASLPGRWLSELGPLVDVG